MDKIAGVIGEICPPSQSAGIREGRFASARVSTEKDSLLLESGHLGPEVIAHEVQLVTTVALRRMYGQLCRG